MTDKQLYSLIHEEVPLAPSPNDDPPEKYELDEKLMKGNETAKKLVIETYDNIDFLFGKYIANYITCRGLFYWGYLLMYFSILLFTGIGIWVSIMWNKFFFPPFIIVAVLIAALVFIMYRKAFDIYFYKTKDNKTVTIYKSKYYMVINNNRQLYRFFNNKWKKLNWWNHNLGTRLLFSKMVGKLSIKKKNDKMIIYGYCDCANMKLKNCVLNSIYLSPMIIAGPFRNQQCGRPMLIKNIEINTNRYAKIPKSFIDFCKEQGIEPPEECEHLHYV